jgi:TPR repeat protein
MQSGDIAAARLLFEELARKQSAKGARALAETYDPEVLKSVLIAGLRPDIEKAKKWYQRAAELGDGEAAARVSALSAR